MDMGKFPTVIIGFVAILTLVSSPELKAQRQFTVEYDEETLFVTVSDIEYEPLEDATRITAVVSTSLPATYNLLVHAEKDAKLDLRLDDRSGFSHHIFLDRRRFSVTYNHLSKQNTVQWVRYRGTLFDAIRFYSADFQRQEISYPFNEMPGHRLALRVLDQLDTGVSANDIYVISSVYSRWVADEAPNDPITEWDSWLIEEQERLLPGWTASKVETAPASCIIPRPGSAKTGEITLDVLGVKAFLTAAEVNMGAMCVAGHSLATSSNANVKKFDASGSSCPMGWDIGSPPDMKEEKVEFEGEAEVKPEFQCCHNGPTDEAKAATASLTFHDVDTKVTGSNSQGDWIQGNSQIKASGRVCRDEDLIWNDVTDIALEGKSGTNGL